MTTYAFDQAASTTIASITDGSLAGGSDGVLSDLVTNGSGQAENSNNFSVVGIYKAGVNQSAIVIPSTYNFGNEFAAPIICTDGSNQGYAAFLGNQSGTTYSRVTFRKDGGFLANVNFTTPIDMADGNVTLDLSQSGSSVICAVYQAASLFETLSTTDGTPLARSGAGFAINRDSGVVQVESWNDYIAGDETAPVLSSPTATKTGSTTADGTVSTDEANGTLHYYASTNASDTALTIKTNGSSQAVSVTGVQSVAFTGLSPSTAYYAHYVQEDAAGNQSNVVSSSSFTTDAPVFAITSISNSTPDAGSTTTILFGNETGAVTASCSAGALTGTYSSGQFVLDIPEPPLFGDKSLNYETSVTITLDDGSTTDTVNIEIQVPTGELFSEITDIDSDGVYANDTGLVVGDFAHFKNITGDIVIDPATGLYAANPSQNTSFEYSLYDISDNTWSDAYQANSYTAETVPPVITLRGANPLVWVQGVVWSDPGADVTDNVDATRIINADSPPNINNIGSQVISYNTADAAGNDAAEVTRTVNVVSADSTPDQFTFVDVANAELSTAYESVRQITGVDAGQTLTATGDLTVSNDGGSTYSSSVQMVIGQTYVKASLTSSASNSTAVNSTGSVNGITDTFTVTTKAAVTLTFTTPDADAMINQSTGSVLTAVVPIVEAWTAAPEEGGTLVDSWANVSVSAGIATFSGSTVQAATDYVLIFRTAGDIPTGYYRRLGQFA